MSDPVVDLVWLAVATTPFILDDIVRRSRELPRASSEDVVPAPGVLLLSSSAGFACAFFAFWDSPGVTKAGRVLIDDSLSGLWEQSARRLDRDWYGDMSTYSFSLAAELLGYFYSVEVNVQESLSSDLLRNADVLVIKTPERELLPAEVSSILDWVRSGGGLFLIGDHTNLFGNSAQLNRLGEPSGIRFKFDSVSDARTSAFSVYDRPLLGAHAVASRVAKMEFMSSCSLELDGFAQPIMVVGNSVSQPGDYANPSFFGTLHSNPSAEIGPMVLAASSRLGSGRVVAFSDSTVLSSFAVTREGRSEFLLGAIDYLNRKDSYVFIRYIPIVAIAGMIALIVFVGYTNRQGAHCAADSCAIVAAGGALLGVSLASCANWFAYAGSSAIREVPGVSVFVDEGALPPVLGGIGHLDPDYCYDTMFTAISRGGIFPTVASSLEELTHSRAAIWVSPGSSVDTDDVTRLASFVRGGGSLVVMIRDDHRHLDALHNLFSLCGLNLDEVLDETKAETRLSDVSDTNVVKGVRSSASVVGTGRLVVLCGLEWLSRDRLGHCFDMPGHEQRESAEGLYAAIEQIVPSFSIDRKTFVVPSN